MRFTHLISVIIIFRKCDTIFLKRVQKTLRKWENYKIIIITNNYTQKHECEWEREKTGHRADIINELFIARRNCTRI